MFHALIQREPPHPVARNFVTKNQSSWAAHSENSVILACTILIQYSSVMDRRTDAQAIAETHEAFCSHIKTRSWN